MYSLNPLDDRRWSDFVSVHPQASVFHNVGWLAALNATFDYEPVVITSTPPGEPLRDGIAFCKIDSWLTGRRLVSLPFADHCEPLTSPGQDASDLVGQAMQFLAKDKPKYVECRPVSRIENVDECRGSHLEYWFHELDLRPPLDTLFKALHKDSIQRKIRRAERDGLIYRDGRGEDLLRDFFHLFVLTRRRHGAPPHPILWFHNLIRFFEDGMKIRVAYSGDRPVAAILTLQHNRNMVYKYGASDPETTNLGGTPLLFWRTIQEAHQLGMEKFDLGRSDLDGEGLIVFKSRWGAAASKLLYLRSRVNPGKSSVQSVQKDSSFSPERLARAVMTRLPLPVLARLGHWAGRHVG